MGARQKLKKGLYWHVHHDTLLEYCYNYGGRVKFIKRYKKLSEQEIRIQLFKPVKGKISDRVSRAIKHLDSTKPHKCATNYATIEKAFIRLDKALAAADKQRITELHEKECPNCPWNEFIIF